MKVQCDRCREIVGLEFGLAERGIEVHCPSCDARYTVAATSAGGAAAPSLPPPTTCPKCGEGQPKAEACRRCGLIFAKWRGVEGLADASAPRVDDAREGAALWAACEAAWEDGAAHDRFLVHVQRTSAYAYAAARYRAAQAQRGGADPVAAERLKRVRAMAEAALLATAAAEKNPKESTPYRASMVVLAVLVLLLGGGILYGLFFRSSKVVERKEQVQPTVIREVDAQK